MTSMDGLLSHAPFLPKGRVRESLAVSPLWYRLDRMSLGKARPVYTSFDPPSWGSEIGVLLIFDESPDIAVE